MIIDKTDVKFSDVPENLNGEVLLERAFSPEGIFLGFITAKKEIAAYWASRTPEERKAAGWDRHEAVLEKVRDQLPPPPSTPSFDN